MEYAVIVIAALLVSGLALFSGFGIGTLLMPVFAIFFPIETAIAATAVVHLANNLFRVGLVGRGADRKAALAFSIPAAALAVVGALILVRMTELPELASYSLGEWDASVGPAKLIIAVLIAAFAVFDLAPGLSEWRLDRRYLPIGGALSGFFGGLSGHQGALRSAFLTASGISAREFIGTAALAALVVDVSRLLVYGTSFFSEDFSTAFGERGAGVVGAATIAAFVGTFAGSRMIHAVTITTIRRLVGALLLIVAIGLATGLI